MSYMSSLKINFRGGIISPGELHQIMVTAAGAGILYVRFGLRQQLLMEVPAEQLNQLVEKLAVQGFQTEKGNEAYPNVVSSYPAADIFINRSWLKEGIYKDIFDQMDYQPALKINISDNNQSFTPLFTGNINWVASPEAPHFWHLFVRFPKTNIIFEWNQMVYTNDVARMSRQVEKLIMTFPERFYDNPAADGQAFFQLIDADGFITRATDNPVKLHVFNLPYYEGLNRYQDRYWLGIYSRDELFAVSFLKSLCQLCLETKIGQLCCTPWKSIIVKNIEDKDRPKWNALLSAHRINMRHAANELNFQVEDNCKAGVELKSFLVNSLHKDDTRTFGTCIGIKTRRKSEVFCNILVRRRFLIDFWGIRILPVYDILCAKDFNPNERTGTVFSKNNTKSLLPEQLRRAIFSFYKYEKKNKQVQPDKKSTSRKTGTLPPLQQTIYQCKHCLTVYDAMQGDAQQGIAAGTAFKDLPETFGCSLCESPKADFITKQSTGLILQAV
jgi:rubredoxin